MKLLSNVNTISQNNNSFLRNFIQYQYKKVLLFNFVITTIYMEMSLIK